MGFEAGNTLTAGAAPAIRAARARPLGADGASARFAIAAGNEHGVQEW
jgi:hypothetical protein